MEAMAGNDRRPATICAFKAIRKLVEAQETSNLKVLSHESSGERRRRDGRVSEHPIQIPWLDRAVCSASFRPTAASPLHHPLTLWTLALREHTESRFVRR
jgi:hypothetical protein